MNNAQNTQAMEAQRGIEKVGTLPKGKIFDDAKNIESVFKKSAHAWHETIAVFEANQDGAKVASVSIANVHVTQPNIQANKVGKMIADFGNLPIINAVQFNDAIVIYDGHHRLMTAWALGMTEVEVNLVKL
jgi:hypothetical protein